MDTNEILRRAGATALQAALGVVIAAGAGALTGSLLAQALTVGLIAGLTIIHRSLGRWLSSR